MTDKRQLSCLRCGAVMRFIGRDKFQRRPDLFRGPPVSGAIGLDEQRVPVCERPSGHEGSRPAGNAGALFEHGQSPVRRRLIEVREQHAEMLPKRCCAHVSLP